MFRSPEEMFRSPEDTVKINYLCTLKGGYHRTTSVSPRVNKSEIRVTSWFAYQRSPTSTTSINNHNLEIGSSGRLIFKFIFIGVKVVRAILLHEGTHIYALSTLCSCFRKGLETFLFFQVDPSVRIRLTECQTVSGPTSRSI